MRLVVLSYRLTKIKGVVVSVGISALTNATRFIASVAGAAGIALTLSSAAQAADGTDLDTSPNFSLATTPNAIAANNAAGSYGGLCPCLLVLASAVESLGTAAEANRAGNQLSADPHNTGVQLATQPAMDVLNVVTAHADGARRLAMNAEQQGISAGESAPGFRSWGEVYGGGGHQDGQGQFGGYTLSSAGLVAGGDLPVAESGLRVGGVFTFSNAKLHDQGDRTGDSTGLDAYGLLGYGSYLGSRAYADVVAGAMFDQFDTHRVVDFTGVSGAADGTHNGVQFVARADGGIPFNFGAPKTPTTLAPVWGLTVSHLDQSAYTETGAREIVLKVGSEASTSVKGEAGFKLEHSFQTSLGMVVPELRAVVRHEFDTRLQFQTASFAADETNPVFGTQSMQPNVNSMVYTVGATLLGDRDVAVTVKYDVETANGFLNQTGSLRVRWAF